MLNRQALNHLMGESPAFPLGGLLRVEQPPGDPTNDRQQDNDYDKALPRFTRTPIVC
jgi:hypothetical protein